MFWGIWDGCFNWIVTLYVKNIMVKSAPWPSSMIRILLDCCERSLLTLLPLSGLDMGRVITPHSSTPADFSINRNWILGFLWTMARSHDTHPRYNFVVKQLRSGSYKQLSTVHNLFDACLMEDKVGTRWQSLQPFYKNPQVMLAQLFSVASKIRRKHLSRLLLFSMLTLHWRFQCNLQSWHVAG